MAVLLPLDTWQNFYVIVGTAAATLTGLMFVVITLIAQIQISSPRSHVTVFTTSNVFHFGAVLLAAGILSAPWQALWPAAWSCGSSRGDLHAHRALAGTPPSGLSTGALRLDGLAARLLRRPRRRGDCAPESAGTALFVIAAVTMLLLFIGIHNAWDVVTYTAFERSQPQITSLGNRMTK